MSVVGGEWGHVELAASNEPFGEKGKLQFDSVFLHCGIIQCSDVGEGIGHAGTESPSIQLC